MDWYALTHLGAEEALQRELASIGVDAETRIGGCAFTATEEEAADVLWRSQVMTRLLVAVAEGPLQALDLTPAHDRIPEGETYRVSAETVAGGPQDLTSTEIAAELGAQVDRPVDLENPQHDLYVQAGPVCLAGLDVAGDLSRRYYRIFTNRRSVKGSFAASLLWLWDVHGGVLDPFANTGEVAIEAALRATGKSHLAFQRFEPLREIDAQRSTWKDEPHDAEHAIWCVDPDLGNLRSCKKNAKLAGVDKPIGFSKLEPEWIDVKFDEAEIGSIITIPPPVTKRNPDSDHLKELCYQAEYILREGGRLIVGCITPETAHALAGHAKSYKLRLLDERVVQSGLLPIQVVCYGM